MDKLKVYFAGPLFNKAEKDFNLKVCEVLERYGYEVFLPQRDGYEAAAIKDMNEKEKTDLIFREDVSKVLSADILVMVLDGRVPDDGACVELGIAYAKGKRCYGVKTDVRSIETGMDLNPMLAGCFIKIFKNFDGDELLNELAQFLENDKL